MSNPSFTRKHRLSSPPVTNWLVILLLTAVLAGNGCTTTRTSDTARTGMEQLLISNAVDQTLEKVPFAPVSGRKVFVEEKYLDCVDKGYVVGSIRQRLLAAGATLTDAKEGSDITLELRSGGVGTDNVESFVGIPGMALPGPVPFEMPEVRFYEKSSQFGTAKLGIVAYQTESGQLVYDSGKALARADDSRWSMLGVGPFQSGTVRNEVLSNTGDIDMTARVANTLDTPFK